jgi:hypothetical protein
MILLFEHEFMDVIERVVLFAHLAFETLHIGFEDGFFAVLLERLLLGTGPHPKLKAFLMCEFGGTSAFA